MDFVEEEVKRRGEWQTKDGSANAKQKDGTQKRYLPKKAWENMSEEEKRATDEKKQRESKEGKQFVANTKKAKESRQKANEDEDEKYAKKKDGEEVDGKEGSEGEKGKKRGRRSKSESTASKKQKKNSGKHDKADAPAKQGSSDRLPDKGEQVHWKSLPGWVDGEVVEVVWEQKEVEGKQAKGSEGSPRVVLKSSSSGRICVHKAEAVYFD